MSPEFRQDPITDRWVIIAPERGLRPSDIAKPGECRRDAAESCPFCPGNEQETPDASLVLGDERGWRVRVVPNKYPALLADTVSASPLGGLGADLPYRSLPGVGVHEVVIESPRHVRSLAELSSQEVCEVFRAYQQRLLAIRELPHVVHATVFKNSGAAAGATLEHVHSQILALPIRPTWVEYEIRGGEEYHRRHGQCAYCELIERERATATRLVLDNSDCIAFCPFASRFGYETWIVPQLHASHFETIAEGERDAVAKALREVVARLETACDHVAYNIILHSAPFDMPALTHYHWHIEILPRLTYPAGFEWGTGVFINHIPPEEAACRLRTLPR